MKSKSGFGGWRSVLVLACAASMGLAGCAAVKSESAPAGEAPASLEKVGSDLNRLTLTEKAVERLGLTTEKVTTGPPHFIEVGHRFPAELDADAEHALFERYASAAGRAGRAVGAVTVLVSHRFSTVRLADLIVVVDGGRISEQGSHAELMAADGQYAELYRIQARAYR